MIGACRIKSFVRTSSSRVASTLRSFTSAEFRVLTNAGEDVTTDEASIELEGEAPVQVEFLTFRRDGGEEETLSPTWTTPTKWVASFELEDGPNEIELLGHDSHGELVGSASVVVTASGSRSGFVRGTLTAMPRSTSAT